MFYSVISGLVFAGNWKLVMGNFSPPPILSGKSATADPIVAVANYQKL
jgi:hypothetical protein